MPRNNIRFFKITKKTEEFKNGLFLRFLESGSTSGILFWSEILHSGTFLFLNWSIKFPMNHAHRNRYCTKIYNQLYFCLFDVFVETASSDWCITWHHPSRETKVGQIDSPFKWRWRHWVSALFNFRETHPRPFENIFVAYFVFSIPKPNRARKFNAQKFKNFEKTVWKNLETRKPRI